MSNKNNDGGQAFPYSGMERIKGPITGAESVLPVWHGGMTLRDYFAAKAMQGLTMAYAAEDPDSWPNEMRGTDDYDVVASHAYEMADAMIKAREE